jgi:hypothetical protein
LGGGFLMAGCEVLVSQPSASPSMPNTSSDDFHRARAWSPGLSTARPRRPAAPRRAAVADDVVETADVRPEQ